MLQHVRGYVYSNDYFFYSVWWSVALFVMIGGYNAFSSYQNRGCFLLKKKLSGIFIPYFFATALYIIYANHFLDATTYLYSLIHFNATGPLYYVAVYIQLLVISPVLMAVIKKGDNRKWIFSVSWVAVIGVSALTTHFTNIFDIVIGGGNLFAGPWIIFWYLGMCIKYAEGYVDVKVSKKWLIVGLTIAVILWQYVFVNRGYNLTLGSIYHGTQVGMTWANAFETVLLFFWFKYAVDFFEENAGDVGKIIIKPLAFMGRYTLYIFLYHMLFISIYRGYLEITVHSINRWICMFFVIVGPVGLGIILGIIRRCFNSIMSGVKVE